MDVVGIGNVAEFCKQRGLRVVEQWKGLPLEYHGKGKTIVWGGYRSMFEFYYTKYRLLCRGIALLSVQDYGDMGYVLDQFVAYIARRERERHGGGRAMFGWRYVNGEKVPVPQELVVADRVLLLRESGCSYREIEQKLRDEGRTTRTGTPVRASTIARICERRELYQSGE